MSETSPQPCGASPQRLETTKKGRRFPVEPVETTTRSSKKDDAGKVQEPTARTDFTKRRIIPELVETSFKSSKLMTMDPELMPDSTPQSSHPKEAPEPRRRFVPELIETSKRSKRAGDSRPATFHTDKTDITPGTDHIYVERQRVRSRPQTYPTPSNTRPLNTVNIPHTKQTPPPLSCRQPSLCPCANTRQSIRRNSFQPKLDPIISEEDSNVDSDDEDEDETSATPSLSGSFSSSEDSMMKLQPACTRESCDDRFSGYLLALAAKPTEKELREQAEAAFPNSDFHEILEHFYDREVDVASNDESVVGTGILSSNIDGLRHPLRRKSTEAGWAAWEMQQHQEKLNRLREDEIHRKVAVEATKPTFQDPVWTNGTTEKITTLARVNSSPTDKQKETELDHMRSAASPPMLGSDLEFRMCPSPKATKFESDQRIDVQPNRSEDGGLWGGYCVAEEDGEYLSLTRRGPTMIHTPYSEREGPFSNAFGNEVPGEARPASSESNEGLHLIAGVHERLEQEAAKSKAKEALLKEFNDTFVTQVYNYLSLGYPSLARQYDEELAKIAQIPEDELAKDDKKADAKGHIGLLEAPSSSVNGPDGYCARWKALRIYILEWASQCPSISNGATSHGAWGVRARRGSWAI